MIIADVYASVCLLTREFEWVEKDEGKKKFFVFSFARLVFASREFLVARYVVIDISIWLARCSFVWHRIVVEI